MTFQTRYTTLAASEFAWSALAHGSPGARDGADGGLVGHAVECDYEVPSRVRPRRTL